MRNRQSASLRSAICSAMGAAALLTFCVSAQAALIVTKDAATSFTRTYTWNIDKAVDAPELTLQVGETRNVEYTVQVDKTTVDSNWKVTGSILIANPDTQDAIIAGIVDVAGGVIANVICPALTVAAGGSITCTYVALMPNASDGINTVTVTTTGGVEGGTGTAPFSFASAIVTTVGYDVVTVKDDSFLISDTTSGDLTLTYQESLQYSEPGFYSILNTAYIEETGQSDSATVNITVVPEPGTLALLGLGLAGLAVTRRRKQ